MASKFKEGQWVGCLYLDKNIIGYIREVINEYKVEVHFPKYGIIDVLFTDELSCMEDWAIHPNDLDSLLDIALMLKDEKWFYQLIKEKSNWVKIN